MKNKRTEKWICRECKTSCRIEVDYNKSEISDNLKKIDKLKLKGCLKQISICHWIKISDSGHTYYFSFDWLPEEFQKELIERMKPEYVTLYHEDGKPAVPKGFDLKGNEFEIFGYSKKSKLTHPCFEYFLSKEFQDFMSEEEIRFYSDKKYAEWEKARFDKAEKVKYADYKFDGQYFINDKYYGEVYDLLDNHFEFNEGLVEDCPTYIWPAPAEPFIKSKDAEDIYINDMEDLDPDYSFDVDGVEELQEAIDLFVEKNEKNRACYPDYSTAILIEVEIKEYLARR